MDAMTADYWISQVWNGIALSKEQKLPKKWNENSHYKFSFLCSCKRIFTTEFRFILNGNSKTCGHCDDKSKDYWLSQTWGKLKLDPNQDLPDEWSMGSHSKFNFKCECGRNSLVEFRKLVRGSTKSCGHCNDKAKEYWLAQTWGKLKLDPNQDLPDEWSMGSQIKFNFKCECGKCIKPHFQAVTGGNSKTCGKCSWKPQDYWLAQKWGELRLVKGANEGWSPNSAKVFSFHCSCGHKIRLRFHQVTTGNSRTCGHCNDKPKEYWLAQTWGKLKLDPNQELPDEWGVGYRKLQFLCNCGNSHTANFYDIAKTSSCGRCYFKPKAYWLAKTWGKLRLDPEQELPDEWGRGSHIIVRFLCDCGVKFTSVFYGTSESCGKCSNKPKEYWLAQTWGKLKLDPNQDLPDEWSYGVDRKYTYTCTCGGALSPLFRDVYSGKTRSCGCGRTGQGEFSPENEVRVYVRVISEDTYPTSYPIEGTRKSYDIYIPSNKLAIEHHGLIWHSEKYSTGARDHEKLLLARDRGDRLIQIYSDEWRDKQEIMKDMLTSLITHPKGKRIKPTFSLEYTTSKEARSFLDQHHYLGAASGCLTAVAKHGEAIVGVWVFMKREEGVILWHRACVDHKFKMWNPHEKVLHLALPVLKEMGFKKMITFSDNRFHTGQLYEKLGFKFEKELKPDYGYTDGTNRVSKYNLRVKAGINEKASAQAKGWFRIWDSGKKRFSLAIC
jgi:predicted SprT family Zn-dependent metalloprotease